jgi:hypothetical protein
MPRRCHKTRISGKTTVAEGVEPFSAVDFWSTATVTAVGARGATGLQWHEPDAERGDFLASTAPLWKSVHAHHALGMMFKML